MMRHRRVAVGESAGRCFMANACRWDVTSTFPHDWSEFHSKADDDELLDGLDDESG